MNLGDSSISKGGQGFVSESSDDELYDIHGIAIGSNDITRGSTSGERKLWLPEVLESSAHTLEGKQLVVDHENRSSRDVVGEITEARFEEGVGVIYQGVLDDDELASKVGRNWLEVSPRLIHSDEFEELEDVKVPQEIYRFDNLSIVSKGAAKSNEINLGQHEELAEELQSAFESEGVAEYQQRVEQLQAHDLDIEQYLYDSPEAAEGASQGFNCSGYHEHSIEGETWYMPCSNHTQFIKNLQRKRASENGLSELAEFSEGSFVQWDNGSAHGKIVDWTDNGTYDASIDGDVTVTGTTDDPAALIQIYQDSEGMWQPEDTMVGHKFSTLNSWTPSSVSENQEVEEMLRSDARRPEYDGTEESSWGDVPADTLSFYVDALGYDDVGQVDDLTQEQKSEISQHTILGDPEADNVRELRFFPVVNAETGDLNRGALEAVRSGRGQSADVPESAYESAYEIAGELLEDEFDADIEVEMQRVEEMAYVDEKSRIASQMASHSKLMKAQCGDLLDAINPDEDTDLIPLSQALAIAIEEDEDDMYQMLNELVDGEDADEEPDDSYSGLRRVFG